MLTENINNLFKFIDFLHSKTEYLLSKQNLIDETNLLIRKRNSIRPNENYKSKIEYDKVQKQIVEKFDVVEAEIIFPLKEKISELNIADVSTPIINLNAQSDLFELQRNFEEDDLQLIFEAKQKYLNFRNETNCDYYLQIFFFELDRALNEFYEFFKDEDFNEFNKLQTNVVTAEILDEQGLENAVRKLTSNSNKLHFETFPEFLNYLKKEVENLEFETEPFRLLNLQRIKLESATFQSEINEIKALSENAIKNLKDKLFLSFTNENYKTKYNGGFNPRLLEIVKIYSHYKILYNDAKHRNKKTINDNLLESEKYEQSKRILISANKKDTERLNIKDGEKFSIFPEPKNREEAIERFKKFSAARELERLQKKFENKYGRNINTRIIEDELQLINEFINSANKLSVVEAFENKDKSATFEYLRLAHGYYENSNRPYYSFYTYFSNDNDNGSSRIYGKYFLYKKWLEDKKKFIDEITPLLKALPPQQMKDKKNNINLTTAISLQAKETIFSILKDFFDTEQQDEFKEVLTTFGTAKNKLVFKSNANKFTDTFKKLFENNFIVGCQKTDLIDWIVLNFKFIYRNEGKEFKTKTVEQIISGNQTFCKKPIIEIKNGQILKIDY